MQSQFALPIQAGENQSSCAKRMHREHLAKIKVAHVMALDSAQDHWAQSGSYRTKASEFRAAAFFVYRTPLLPIEEWTDWSEELSAPSVMAGGVALAVAVAADQAALWGRLRTTLARPEVRQALFLAAPGVDEELEHLGFDGKPDRKLCRTLVRYFARMTGRATPFGLFAGCSLGRLGKSSTLHTVSIDQYRTFTTLDVGFLHGVAERLKDAAEADLGLCLRTNPTIYRAGRRIRYIEIKTEPGTLARSYHLCAITPTDAIDAVLDRAAEGATVDDLAETVRRLGHEASRNKARAFIVDLLHCHVLVGGIEPRNLCLV